MKVLNAINLIMTTLFRLGAPCVYVKGVQTLSNFEVFVDPVSCGTRVNKVTAAQKDLSLAVGRTVRVAPRDRFMVIQVPLANRKFPTLSMLQTQLRVHEPWHALLGYKEDGSIMSFDISQPSIAHVGVFGTTGSGKTLAMRSMIASLCIRHRRNELLLYAYSPKWNNSDDFSRIVGGHLISPPDVEPESAGRVLTAITKQMDKRPEGSVIPRIIIMIDEAADLCASSFEAQAALTQIATRGRGVGFHLIVGTQKPTAAALSSLMTANLPTRVVGRVVNARESNTATGMTELGAEMLLGLGDFIVIKAGQESRVQGVYPDLSRVTTPDIVDVEPFKPKQRAVVPVNTMVRELKDDGLSEWASTQLQMMGTLRAMHGYKHYTDYCNSIGLSPATLVKWGKYMRNRYVRETDKSGVFYDMVSVKS
jgi:DNA segregation ATPase FtsK/SpoIIIE, S-DNA-T family